MIRNRINPLATICLLIVVGTSARADEPPKQLKILSGEPRLMVVNGYSTSYHWWQFLQRKLDKHFGQRVVEVQLAARPGSPIPSWIDVTTGEPRRAWQRALLPALASKGDRPAIVLAQQSLQRTFGGGREGIRSDQDVERIKKGGDVLQTFAERMLADGADELFIAMHIYKKPMEPEIGNERLALTELLKRGMAHVYAGPDVWEPTKKHYPKAFAGDRLHPNSIGAEIMAQLWFETLLRHDGLDVPQWSRDEMARAINAEPQELPPRIWSQDGDSPSGQAAARFYERIKSYDKNADGRVTKEEASQTLRNMFGRFDTNGDGVIDKTELEALKQRS